MYLQVGELRRELENRNIASKGLRSQLVARLVKALKSEQSKEEEEAENKEEEVRAPYYECKTYPMGVQLSLKPVLPFVESIATLSDICCDTGHRNTDSIENNGCRDFFYEDEMMLTLSYLYNRDSCTMARQHL